MSSGLEHLEKEGPCTGYPQPCDALRGAGLGWWLCCVSGAFEETDTSRNKALCLSVSAVIPGEHF